MLEVKANNGTVEISKKYTKKYRCEKSNNWKKLHHIPMGRKDIETCFDCGLPFC